MSLLHKIEQQLKNIFPCSVQQHRQKNLISLVVEKVVFEWFVSLDRQLCPHQVSLCSKPLTPLGVLHIVGSYTSPISLYSDRSVPFFPQTEPALRNCHLMVENSVKVAQSSINVLIFLLVLIQTEIPLIEEGGGKEVSHLPQKMIGIKRLCSHF